MVLRSSFSFPLQSFRTEKEGVRDGVSSSLLCSSRVVEAWVSSLLWVLGSAAAVVGGAASASMSSSAFSAVEGPSGGGVEIIALHGTEKEADWGRSCLWPSPSSSMVAREEEEGEEDGSGGGGGACCRRAFSYACSLAETSSKLP